jgi:hypothetical protein
MKFRNCVAHCLNSINVGSIIVEEPKAKSLKKPFVGRIANSTYLNVMYGWELKCLPNNTNDPDYLLDDETERFRVLAHVHDFSGGNIWRIDHVEGGKHRISSDDG